MDLRSLIQEGRLSEARSALVEEVKSSPADTAKRTLLFQVLAVLGEWDKAARHLDMISTQDPARVTGAHVFMQLIEAEKERLDVFALKKTPSFMTEAPEYFGPWHEAARKLLGGDAAAAHKVFTSVAKEVPEVSGTVNGEPFKGLRDTDSVLAPFLEAFIHGRYLWIPFASIRELTIPGPRSFTDLIWIQADFVTWEGLTAGCYLPVLYPGSSAHGDEAVRIGRMMGQHVYEAGDAEKAILEIRELRFTYRK
jgi:type VI secretion system protein ImpE